jgi:hypothetical protein
VELFAAIRRDARVEELSIRGLADRYHVHRRTVRQALAAALPPPRKTPVRTARVLEPFQPAIETMLRADLEAPRKQRHTARRILARLVDEHQADGLSYSTVRDYVAKRRPEIWAEAGRSAGEGFVPQDHAFGAEGEVDFADLWVTCAGSRPRPTCSRSGCPRRARRSTEPSALKGRRRFWRATSTPSPSWVECRSGMSATTVSVIVLPADPRPLPTVHQYDALLSSSKAEAG